MKPAGIDRPAALHLIVPVLVCIACGRGPSGPPGARVPFPDLGQAPFDEVAEQVVRDLGLEGLPHLERGLATARDPRVISALLRLAAELGTEGAGLLPAVREHLSNNRSARLDALRAMMAIHAEPASTVVTFLEDEDPELRREAAAWLAGNATREQADLLPLLERCRDDAGLGVSGLLGLAVARIRDSRALSPAERLAQLELSTRGSIRLIHELGELSTSGTPEVARRAGFVLRYNRSSIMPLLERAAENGGAEARLAMETIGRMGPLSPRAESVLFGYLRGSNPFLALKAARALAGTGAELEPILDELELRFRGPAGGLHSSVQVAMAAFLAEHGRLQDADLVPLVGIMARSGAGASEAREILVASSFRSVPYLVKGLAGADPRHRADAEAVMEASSPPEPDVASILPWLRSATEQERHLVRARIISCLAEIGRPARLALRALDRIVQDRDDHPWIRYAADRAAAAILPARAVADGEVDANR